ncbi:MAG: glycosyltransferase family 4 protein [Candidatus Hodarchaeota archaeon]
MKKINLVHIQVLPIMSGVQKVMVDFLIHLDRRRYDIKVICHAEGELTNVLTKHKISYIILPELRRKINLYFDVIAFLKLISIFKKYKFNIVHTHSSKPGFLGRLAAKIAGVQVIIHTVHGFAFHQFSSKWNILIFQLLEKIAGLAADKIILLNKTDFEYAIKNRIANVGKLIKIYNGIPLDKFDFEIDIQKKKYSLNIPNDYFIVGSVGRLWEQKSPHDFIAAIPDVLKQVPNTYFLVIGNGHLRKDLESLSEKLSIQNYIKFLGWRNDVPEILKILDVFVQTSLWEGLSLSILEAMATRKPIVATNIKGNNELILNNRTGFLIQPNDFKKLASNIIRLLKNKKLAKGMGREGRKRVEEKFNINSHVEQIENIYNQLLSSSYYLYI